VADAWNSIKIRQFEHVMVSPTVVLLRVSGKASRRRSDVGPRPSLITDDGQTTRRFTAVPSPPDERGVLRAAYSVSSDLVAPTTAFSLELSDGTVLGLPAPRPGTARLASKPGPESSSEAADAPERPHGGDERRSGLVSKLTELSARLADSEQARDQLVDSVTPLHEAGERAEHELVGARERTSRAEADAKKSTAALEELDTWRGELERRLTETTDELSSARTTLARDEAALLRMGEELAEERAKVEILEVQVNTLTDRLAQVDQRSQPTSVASEPAPPAAGAEALAVAHAEIEDLRAQVAQARDAEAQARLEAVAHAAEAEARELAEQELAQAASPGP
jgi:hypothetical protein